MLNCFRKVSCPFLLENINLPKTWQKNDYYFAIEVYRMCCFNLCIEKKHSS
ncbi:unnamed protein product [Larinioides sclopetarius]|uniref:Uncharacterized protein n=1 Tax=Larinioides sclopetarius TaxID=280406 RepID=A0AAV1YY92_9ARAC